MFLTEQEKVSLSQQIREAEQHCEAEIVTVIARASDRYAFIPVLWAALLSLCVPGVYFLLLETELNSWLFAEDKLHNLRNMYIVQVLLFLVLTLLFQWQPVQMRLIPPAVKRQRAHRHAQVQFIEQRVHWSMRRSGILIFVSVAEHYVEIIADQAVAEKVDQQAWNGIVERFITDVKSDRVAAGFTAAVEDCRAILWTHFPANGKKSDELPDHLIEV